MKVILATAIGLMLVIGGSVIWLFSRESIGENYENAPISVASSQVDAVLERDGFSQEVSSAESSKDDTAVTETANLPLEPSETSQEAPSSHLEALAFISKTIAFGYRDAPNPRTIDTIVIHSSYNASGGDVYDIEKIIRQYEDYGVGAHYLIGRDGTLYRLVEEEDIAYHAGVAKMPDGRKNVNDFSIGIELVGTEKSGFTGKQYESLKSLLVDIKGRYTIKNVVGHADIAPDRKTDPWEFDWKRL